MRNNKPIKYLLYLVAITMMGCNSTPSRDDYVRYTNLSNDNYINESNFKFSFASGEGIDLRGLYSSDNSTDSTSVFYSGDAGLLGLLAQIGTHAALVGAQRNKKLTEQQEDANRRILPLIKLTNGMALSDIIGSYNSNLIELEKTDPGTILIKPVFFSNIEMTELSLKLFFWLPNQGEAKDRNNQIRYENMIHVISPSVNESQQEKTSISEKSFLSERLSSLLKTALFITKNEMAGRYKNSQVAEKTFFIDDDSGKKVIRGSLVGEMCGYEIIKDLHSWLIALPQKKSKGNSVCRNLDQT